MAGKTLTVFLAADISKLNSGLSKGKAGLKDFESGSDSLSSKLSGMVGPALIGATAAAGAFAVSLAVDGVKAAIEDEKAVAKLSTTLHNLGFKAETENVLSFIDSLQRTTGISEDLLRPAFERLAIATGDVGSAQTNLKLAMDISVGTGKSMESVANALGKAYEGNTGALGKLGTGIDKAVLKTGDMQLITQELSKTFDGQAAAAADTFAGQLAILSVGFEELKESFGQGFLQGLTGASAGVGLLSQTLEDMGPNVQAAGSMIGELVLGVIKLVGWMGQADQSIKSWGDSVTMNLSIGILRVADALNLISDAQGDINEAQYEAWKLGKTTAVQPGDPGFIGPTAAESKAFIAQRAAAEQYQSMLEKNKLLLNQNQANLNSNSSATLKASAAQKILETRYQATLEVFNLAKTKLSDATRELEKWNDEIDQFITATAGKITSGIDIGAAFAKATSDAGKAAGLTTVKAFQEQLAQSLKFGNSLQKLKSSGAEDNLIQQVAAVGPEAGVQLVEELVQSGMIPEIQAQLNEVESAAKLMAGALVPPFLLAGRDSARGAVVSALIEFNSATQAMEDAGKAIGKSLSRGMLDEINKAIKEAQAALQNVQGGNTYVAATGQNYTAPGGAQMGFQEANFFDIAAYNSAYAADMQSTANSIQRVIQMADNRAGYNTNYNPVAS